MEKQIASVLQQFFGQMGASFEAEMGYRVDSLHGRCDVLLARLQCAGITFSCILNRLRASVAEEAYIWCEEQLVGQSEVQNSLIQKGKWRANEICEAQKAAEDLSEEARDESVKNKSLYDYVTKEQQQLVGERVEVQKSGTLLAQKQQEIEEQVQSIEAMENEYRNAEQVLAQTRLLREEQKGEAASTSCDSTDLKHRCRSLELENTSLRYEIDRLLEIIDESGTRFSTYGVDLVSIAIDEFNADESHKLGTLKQELCERDEQEIRIRELRKQLQGAVDEVRTYEQLIVKVASK